MYTFPEVSKQAANSVFSADRNRKWFQLGIGLALKACLAALMLKWREGKKKRGGGGLDSVSWLRKKARNKVVMATEFIKPPQIPQRDISGGKKHDFKGSMKRKCICGAIYLSVQKLAQWMQPPFVGPLLLLLPTFRVFNHLLIIWACFRFFLPISWVRFEGNFCGMITIWTWSMIS